METKRIKVIVTEKTTKEGKKFNSFETVSKNGRKVTLKFRKEVKDVPTATCYAIVNVDDINVNKSGEFPVVWVKAVQSWEDRNEVALENNRKVVNEFFD